MGKTVGKILRVVGAGLLILSGVGAVMGAGGWVFAGKVGSIGWSATMSLGTMAKRGLMALVLSQSMRKPKMPAAMAGRTHVNVRPDAPRTWAFGEVALAMDMAFAFQSGSKKENTEIVLVHAGHTITEYGRMIIDGKVVTFSGDDATGDWTDLLSKRERLGTESQTAMEIAGSSWGANARLRGLACAAYAFKFDEEQNPRSVPARVLREAKASPVYDVRLDTTQAGGSGSHRADDQATWEYNDGSTDIGRNAALVYATYLLGWQVAGKTVLGCGLDPDGILWDRVLEAANVCETNGWFFDGVLEDPEDGDHSRNLRTILDSMAADPIEEGGKIGLRIAYDDTGTVAHEFEVDNVIGDVIDAGIPEDAPNLAHGRFPDKDSSWQLVDYPEVRLESEITADGREFPVNFDFPATVDGAKAQQLAGLKLREARQPRLETTVDQTGLLVSVGDVVKFKDHQGFDPNGKYRITRHRFDFASLATALTLVKVAASDYALLTPATVATPADPGLVPPPAAPPDATPGATWGVDINTQPPGSFDGEWQQAGSDVSAFRATGFIQENGGVGIGYPGGPHIDDAPFVNPVTGRLRVNQTVDGSSAFPVDTGDSVRIFTDAGEMSERNDAPWATHVAGRPVELTDGRVAAGLQASGVIQLDVPLDNAAANLPALSDVTGRLRVNQTVDGSSAFPVDTGDSVRIFTDAGDLSEEDIVTEPFIGAQSINRQHYLFRTADNELTNPNGQIQPGTAGDPNQYTNTLGDFQALGSGYQRSGASTLTFNLPTSSNMASSELVDFNRNAIVPVRPGDWVGYECYLKYVNNALTSGTYQISIIFFNNGTFDSAVTLGPFNNSTITSSYVRKYIEAVTPANCDGVTVQFYVLSGTNNASGNTWIWAIADSRLVVRRSSRDVNPIVSSNVNPAVASAQPLSASENGTNATISVAQHTREVGGETYTFPAANLTGLAGNQLYYVYRDVTSWQGQTGTYTATTTPTDVSAAQNRVFVDSYTTPAIGSGGSGTGPSQPGPNTP